MRLHQLYGDDIDVKFESLAGDPGNSWLCLRYSIADYWSAEELKIDDKVYLAPTRPHFGGQRWWFVCPHLNRRVRKLYVPPAAVTFGHGALMSLPTPPNERLSLTEPSGALASCA
jgi:hypothetical protein